MKRALLAIAVTLSLLSGCASVPMASPETTANMVDFKKPTEGFSGVYIFRKNSLAGAGLKKDIWIDKECIGESAKGVFFYKEVEGDMKHTISTESDFSPNDLTINTKAGNLYFVKQYIKLGVFVGGAGLEQYNFADGKKEVSKLKMAKLGHCSSTR